MQETASNPNPKKADRRVLAVAIILAAIAAGLIVAYLASRDGDEAVDPALRQVSVVVAAQDIAAGETIDEAMLEVREMPRDAAVNGALEDTEDVAGEVSRYPIMSGEQLTPARLVGANTGTAMSFQIPDGMRGFTIPVDVTTSPVALLAPGDYVDVIVSAEVEVFGLEDEAATPTPEGDATDDEDEEDEEWKAAVTLLQNLQVLSIQRDYMANGVPYDESARGEPTDSDNVTWVTVAVTPAEAQQLWLASQEADFTLTLRSFGDNTIVDLLPFTEPIQLPSFNLAQQD